MMKNYKEVKNNKIIKNNNNSNNNGRQIKIRILFEL